MYQTLAFTIYGKISAPTPNEEFELPDASYSVSDTQDYFKHILKKHENVADNPSIMVSKNRIMFRIKTGYHIELLIAESMKLLGSAKSNINKDKNSTNMLDLEITEVVLVHCSIVNNNYQQDSRVLHLFLINHLVNY